MGVGGRAADEVAAYWLTTVRPDGRPHVAVVWRVWLDNAFYFGTSPQSRKARNLATNPRCVLCPEGADEAVIVEGVAERVTEREVVGRFEGAYRAKYQEEIDTREFPVYRVRPSVVFGFISDAVDWPATATRWRFPSA